ncbi:DUF4435 domain-containing protein [Magnetococcales bacterium HHB-1]
MLKQERRCGFIVESGDDEDFLDFNLDDNLKKRVVYFQVGGWENALKLIDIIYKDHKTDNALAIIDRDYRDPEEFDNSENIVLTDDRDIEMMMFSSNDALERVAKTLGKKERLPQNAQGIVDIEAIRSRVEALSKPLGKLRIYSHINNRNFRFSDLNLSKIFGKKDLSLSLVRLLGQLNGQQKDSTIRITNEDWTRSQDLEFPHWIKEDGRFICSGHDTMTIFGLILRRRWRGDHHKTSREDIEKSFRLAYPEKDLKETALYRKIKNWLVSAKAC